MSTSAMVQIDSAELKRSFLSLQDGEELAHMLGITLEVLLRLSYRDRSYHQFSIPKRKGGERLLNAPYRDLRDTQRRLVHVLSAVYNTKPSAHGFVRGRSIVTNARAHVRKRYVLNIDLQDFFHSITWPRVNGMFLAKPYFLSLEVAKLLTNLCCHNGRLPQGAPTSPIISNMICARMDSELQRFAKSHNCVYTRYADDITISTYLKSFPRSIAHISEIGNQFNVSPDLYAIITSNGFEINPQKIRFSERKHRQEVTGITVNRKTNVPRRFIRDVRAMIHAWRKYGYDAAENRFIERFDYKNRVTEGRKGLLRAVLRGRVEYIGMVRGKDDSLYQNLCSQIYRLDNVLVNDPCELKEASDEFTGLIGGLSATRAMVESKQDNEVNIYFCNLELRLLQSIKKARLYSDSSDNLSERNQVIMQLNRFTLEEFGRSFNELCEF